MTPPSSRHRDLATRNLLLDVNYRVIISDFGMSRANTQNGNTTKAESGPLKWMAPECLLKNEYSFKVVFLPPLHLTPLFPFLLQSDVWAFGVTLWEMLARDEPFRDMPAITASIAVAKDGLRLEIPSQVPSEIALIIQSCWEKDPHKRPDFKSLHASFSAL